jgi:hypothetical protein
LDRLLWQISAPSDDARLNRWDDGSLLNIVRYENKLDCFCDSHSDVQFVVRFDLWFAWWLFGNVLGDEVVSVGNGKC